MDPAGIMIGSIFRVSWVIAYWTLLTAAAGEVQAQSNSSSLERYVFDAEPAAHWKLHDRLKEISGLATTADGRLLAHDDEKALIYEVDYLAGELVKVWAFGHPTAVDDFEGIAVADGRIFLITSRGRLYEGTEGDDGDRVLYNTYELGLNNHQQSSLGRQCEIEGLEFEPDDRTLLILCKTARTEETANSLLLSPLAPVQSPARPASYPPPGDTSVCPQYRTGGFARWLNTPQRKDA